MRKPIGLRTLRSYVPPARVGRPGHLREHRWQLPVGPEDITYWPSRDQLWSLSEYPGARYVYAMPRGRFLREGR